MASNPLFVVVQDESVLLVQRLFDSYRWLHTETGEIESGCYYDLAEDDSFQIAPQLALRKQHYYEIDTALFNLFQLLLPPSDRDQSNEPLGCNTWFFRYRTEDRVFVGKSSSDAGEGCDIAIRDIWKSFFSSRLKRWQTQYESVPSVAFLLFPDCIPRESVSMLETALQSCGIPSVQSVCSSSILPHYLPIPERDTRIIHLDLTDSYIHVCILQKGESSSGVCQSIDSTQSPLTLLSQRTFNSFSHPQCQLSPSQVDLCMRQLHLQCKAGIIQNVERISLYEEGSQPAPLFSVSLPSLLFQLPTAAVTNAAVYAAVSESGYLQRLQALLASLEDQKNTVVVAEGMYSHVTCVRRLLQSFHSRVLYRGSNSLFIQHCTDQINTCFATLCNDFCFVDHNVSLAIQDGFALTVLNKGEALPCQRKTTLTLSLAANEGVSLHLLRGDSMLTEENVLVLSIPLQFTPSQRAVGSVVIHVTVCIDRENNLIVHVADSFGAKETLSLSARDFLNSSNSSRLTPLYEKPRPPRCSRQRSYYQGEMADGRANGFGRLYDAQNQLKFEGMWENGLFSGKGIYYLRTGGMIIGSFREGRVDGYAVWYDALGLVVQQGLCHNVAIDDPEPANPSDDAKDDLLAFVGEPMADEEYDQPVYEGERENGVPNGYGVLYDPNHVKIYEGNFVRGVYSGHGCLYEEGQLKYRGSFEHGVPNGEGFVYSPQGNVVMSGEFLDGLPWGLCCQYSDDASHQMLFRGFFLRGKREGLGHSYDPSTRRESDQYYLHDHPFEGGFVMLCSPFRDSCCPFDVTTRECRNLLKQRYVILSLNGESARFLAYYLSQNRVPAMFSALTIDSVPCCPL